MRKELRIAGFGGQGVITIGVLLAKAVGQYGDKFVAQTQSYGPEARGGACKTDLVISEQAIDYIKPLALKTLIVMAQPALNAYGQSLPDDALIIADSTLVTAIPPRFKQIISAPVTDLAENTLKSKILANVIMFGLILKTTSLTSHEQGKQALADQMPPKALEQNYQAFDLGYNLGANRCVC